MHSEFYKLLLLGLTFMNTGHFYFYTYCWVKYLLGLHGVSVVTHVRRQWQWELKQVGSSLGCIAGSIR